MKHDSTLTDTSGFTLVEMSIVILIIGLLVGAVLGGQQILENSKAMDLASKFQLYEASAIKFRDIYGELPGDLRDPASRLTDCTAAPCTNAGDGDGGLDSALASNAVLSLTDERFSFWNHMLKAGLISGFNGSNSMDFGDGQPSSSTGGGFRVYYNSTYQWWPYYVGRPSHAITLFNTPSLGSNGYFLILKCSTAKKIDEKFDDGRTGNGKIQIRSTDCSVAGTVNSLYDAPNGRTNTMRWITKF